MIAGRLAPAANQSACNEASSASPTLVALLSLSSEKSNQVAFAYETFCIYGATARGGKACICPELSWLPVG
jgi:hypothetical protein